MKRKIIKIYGIGGKAFPKDYNWICKNGHSCRSFEKICYACRIDKLQANQTN